jgi:hypothetical protein
MRTTWESSCELGTVTVVVEMDSCSSKPAEIYFHIPNGERKSRYRCIRNMSASCARRRNYIKGYAQAGLAGHAGRQQLPCLADSSHCSAHHDAVISVIVNVARCSIILLLMVATGLSRRQIQRLDVVAMSVKYEWQDNVRGRSHLKSRSVKGFANDATNADVRIYVERLRFSLARSLPPIHHLTAPQHTAASPPQESC